MRIEGKGIAAGIGVALATLLIIGFASRAFDTNHTAVSPEHEKPADDAVINNTSGTLKIPVASKSVIEGIKDDPAGSLKEKEIPKDEVIKKEVANMDNREEQENSVIWKTLQIGGSPGLDDISPPPIKDTPNLHRKRSMESNEEEERGKRRKFEKPAGPEREEVVELPEYRENFWDYLISLFFGKKQPNIAGIRHLSRSESELGNVNPYKRFQRI
jgi:hypothetical protein